jgi:hypothetical protein
MWKPIAVAGLWGFLVGLPHVASPGQVTVAGVTPGAVVDDDLGDPPLQDPPQRDAPPPQRAIPGSFAVVHFTNELAKTMNIVEARVTMDGAPLPAVANPAAGSDTVVFAGRVEPGDHVVDTTLDCQGRRQGPFTYLKSYKLTIASEEVLTVPRERAVVFTIAATRASGPTVPFDKQIGIAVRAHELPEPGARTN